MGGKPDGGSKRVICVCGDQKVIGAYDVVDGFLILSAPFGDARVPLGIMDPKKLAKKLLKNLCVKACADAQLACGNAIGAEHPA